MRETSSSIDKVKTQASQQILAAVWDASPDAWVLSDADGVVLDANPAYFAFYNLTLEQTVGAPFNIIFPEEFRDAALVQYKEVFANSPAKSTFETEIFQDGETKVVETTISFLTENGRRTALLSCIRDITMHKRRQEELARRTQYEHALAQCSKTLLQSPTSPAEVDAHEQQLKILHEALQHLIGTFPAKTITLRQNFADPELGRYAQLLAAVSNPNLHFSQFEEIMRNNLVQYRQLLDKRIPAISAYSDEFLATVIPWSVIPDELTSQLAAGQWIGGPITQLFAEAPNIRDYLLNQHQTQMFLVFPIHIGNQWWGAITVTDREPRPIKAEDGQTRSDNNGEEEIFWTEDEILLLGTATEMIASTLKRWQVEADLHDMNRQLEERIQNRTVELRKTVELLQGEVDERKRAEAEIQRMVELLEQRVADRSRELSALYDMTILFTEVHNLKDTLEPALSNISGSVDAQGIAVHILSADKSHLQLTAHLGMNDWEELEKVEFTFDFADQLNKADTPFMFVSNASDHPFFPIALLQPAYPTYFGIALRVRRKVIGLLSVYRHGKRPFDTQNVSFLITMAEQLGIIIQNQRLQEQSLQMTKLIERQQLARRLHDSVAQRIYGLHLFARAGHDALVAGDQEEALLRLQQQDKNALYVLREMRLLLYQLRPLALEDQTLYAAFENRFDMVERRLGIEATIEIKRETDLTEDVEEELFYIISEALNNALKHAEATEVKLLFSAENGCSLVTIQDNGTGFDLSQRSSGLGLENMCLRTEQIGGLVTIESATGQGTTVRIII